MKHWDSFLIKGAVWTTGTFGFGVLLRLATNVILTRLLAPELFGIMIIANNVKMGVELITDVGIGQNIVHSPNAENPDFYNTAWTLRLIRAVLLWVACVIAAAPIAKLYHSPVLIQVIPVYSLFVVFSALDSIAVPFLQKKMQFARLNFFEMTQNFLSSFIHIVLAYFNPTVWALVFAGLIASLVRSASSYFLLPDIRPRLRISKIYARQILSFGKWIFLSSALYYFSTYIDTLYFGKIVGLSTVGIYGIARVFSKMIESFMVQFGNNIIFPLVAASQTMARDQLRSGLIVRRLAMLSVAAIGIAISISIGDVIIKTFYDQRYHAASWMLPVLLAGTWFSILSSINEATLLGFGRPVYTTFGSGFKLTWLLIAFPVVYAEFGLSGAIMVVATGDLFRYLTSLVGQIRERFSFAVQDAAITLFLIGLICLFEWLRWSLGFGTSYDGLPSIG